METLGWTRLRCGVLTASQANSALSWQLQPHPHEGATETSDRSWQSQVPTRRFFGPCPLESCSNFFARLFFFCFLLRLKLRNYSTGGTEGINQACCGLFIRQDIGKPSYFPRRGYFGKISHSAVHFLALTTFWTAKSLSQLLPKTTLTWSAFSFFLLFAIIVSFRRPVPSGRPISGFEMKGLSAIRAASIASGVLAFHGVMILFVSIGALRNSVAPLLWQRMSCTIIFLLTISKYCQSGEILS